jgi:hypothetical protein
MDKTQQINIRLSEGIIEQINKAKLPSQNIQQYLKAIIDEHFRDIKSDLEIEAINAIKSFKDTKTPNSKYEWCQKNLELSKKLFLHEKYFYLYYYLNAIMEEVCKQIPYE